MHNILAGYHEDGLDNDLDISDGDNSEQLVVGRQVGPIWGSSVTKGSLYIFPAQL